MKNINTNIEMKVRIIYSVIAVWVLFLCSCSTIAPMPSALPENVSVKQLVGEAVGVVQAGLADPEPLTRVNAAEAAASGHLTKLMPKVRHLLKDPIVPVRFATAMAIGDMEFSLGRSDLEKLLEDSDENVRIAAAYAMKKIEPSSNIESIRKAITSDNQTIRANATMLLGKCGDQSDLKLLYWALQHQDSSDKVRFQAVESIAMFHDERIYPKIWTMLLSVYADDRVMGTKAMGALGSQKAKEALMTMLEDPVLEVKLSAAEQLGALGESTGEPQVLDVFRKNMAASAGQEDAVRVKIWSAFAIGRMCTPSLTRFLPELLKDSSKSVRLAAAKAVLQCSDRKK